MLGVKELLIKLLTDIQKIKQKLNKPMIVSNSIMTSAEQCNANSHCITEGSYTTPSGYRAFAAHVTDTTNVRFLTRSCYFIANSKVRVYGYNPTSSTMTNCQARVEILYQLIEGGGKFIASLFTPFSYKKGVGVCLI